MKQGRIKPTSNSAPSPSISPWIAISIVVHIVLFGMIALTIDEPEVAPKSVVAVKSYLYKAPIIKKAELVTIDKVETKTPHIENKQAAEKPQDNNHQSVTPPPKKNTPVPTTKVAEVANVENKVMNQPSVEVTTSKVLTSNQGKATINTSAFNHLDKLRASIDQQIVSDELTQMNQHRSLSGMHPNPAPAPTSLIPLTRQQKKEKNTTRYSDSLSVIKGEDGRCGIEEDLSHVGIEGVKAYSGFNCGESKFDRSFRQHMKKVRGKIGK